MTTDDQGAPRYQFTPPPPPAPGLGEPGEKPSVPHRWRGWSNVKKAAAGLALVAGAGAGAAGIAVVTSSGPASGSTSAVSSSQASSASAKAPSTAKAPSAAKTPSTSKTPRAAPALPPGLGQRGYGGFFGRPPVPGALRPAG